MTPVPAALADEATRATTASDAKADKPIRLSDANLDSVTAGAVRNGFVLQTRKTTVDNIYDVIVTAYR
jgi:hypothetical protein